MEKSSMKISSFGRICLMGEHTDWTKDFKEKNRFIIPGKAIIFKTKLGIFADVCKNENIIIRNKNDDFNIKNDLKVIYKYATNNGYYSYCAAAAYMIRKQFNIGGILINITDTTLPIKKGFASSAAISYLVVHSFNKVYNLGLSIKDEMELAYKAERMKGVNCGLMDYQSIEGDQITCIDFKNNKVKNISTKSDLYFVHADLCGEKNTKIILDSLQKIYPFPKNYKQLKAHLILGLYNRYLCNRTIKSIEKGKVEKIGKYMNKSQEKFDKYISCFCESQLLSPKLHKIINSKEIIKLSYGIKGHGSQGDGSVQILAKDENAQNEIVRKLRKMGYPAYRNNYKSKKINRAVIALCGKGERLKPYTKLLNKEFCPVIYNGKLTPIIDCLLKYIDSMGIDNINIAVSSRKQKRLYKQYFKKTNNTDKDEQYLKNIYKKIKFIMVKNSKGFGDTVFRFKKVCDNKPCMLFLGDTLYPDDSAKQIFDIANDMLNKYNKPILFLSPKNDDQVENCGISTGKKVSSNIIKINKIFEKPNIDYCKKNLQIDSQNYGIYGIYVLTKDIFRMLEYSKKAHDFKSEFQLTEALKSYIKNDDMYGILLDKDSYDFGNIMEYAKNFDKKI